MYGKVGVTCSNFRENCLYNILYFFSAVLIKLVDWSWLAQLNEEGHIVMQLENAHFRILERTF